ncbi:MAG: hypothetical protein JW791_01100 [Nanoarchaeota archaeon]|nr:hypothetical protein [Nanoarchaeota archaeon]
MYENNLERASTFLANFLFGCEDNIENQGFKQLIEPEKIKPYIQQLYQNLFQQGWINDARRLGEWLGIQPKKKLNFKKKRYHNSSIPLSCLIVCYRAKNN